MTLFDSKRIQAAEPKLLRKHNLAADNREGGKIPRKLQTQTKGMFYMQNWRCFAIKLNLS